MPGADPSQAVPAEHGGPWEAGGLIAEALSVKLFYLRVLYGAPPLVDDIYPPRGQAPRSDGGFIIAQHECPDCSICTSSATVFSAPLAARNDGDALTQPGVVGRERPLRTSFGRWKLGPGWSPDDDPKLGQNRVMRARFVRDRAGISRQMALLAGMA